MRKCMYERRRPHVTACLWGLPVSDTHLVTVSALRHQLPLHRCSTPAQGSRHAPASHGLWRVAPLQVSRGCTVLSRLHTHISHSYTPRFAPSSYRHRHYHTHVRNRSAHPHRRTGRQRPAGSLESMHSTQHIESCARVIIPACVHLGLRAPHALGRVIDRPTPGRCAVLRPAGCSTQHGFCACPTPQTSVTLLHTVSTTQVIQTHHPRMVEMATSCSPQ